MSRWLRQSTVVTIPMGPALDATDGVSEEVGLSPTVEVSKNNAVFGARNSATAITHDQNGWYRVELNATDTATTGPFIAKFDDASTHLPVWHEFEIVTANVYDARFSSTLLNVSVSQWLGAAVNALISGRVDASTGAMAAGVVTASAIATDAIDADALAADALAEINAEVDTALTDYDAPTSAELISEINDVQSDIAALNNLSAAQVNAEVVDALATDTAGEPGTGAPPLSASIQDKIAYLYKFMRNRVTSTATTITVFNDDASTAGQVSTHSDDSTTYDRGEFGSG